KSTARFDGPLHNSRRGLAALYRFKPRNIHLLCNQGVKDTIDEVEVRAPAVVIHKSAIERTLANHNEYAPTALAKPWGGSDESRLPMHIDARADSTAHLTDMLPDIGQLFSLHTKARQRLHENVVLSQANHNICVFALTAAIVYAVLMVWPWYTCEPTSLTHYNYGLFLSLALFAATLVYSKHLSRRRRSLADLGLARVRTESDRVVAAAEQGQFKQSLYERLAMVLLGWSFAKEHYKLLVKFVLPVVLFAGLTWLLSVSVATALGGVSETDLDSTSCHADTQETLGTKS
ncbi:MAG: hypothetical protein AAF420_08590, partial [Pseudomonadota bacterium]